VTLVDTNVLLDIVTDDPVWADWSLRQIEAAAAVGPRIINAVIYAELAVRYPRIEDLEAMLASTGLELQSIPREGLFLAGKVFARYRLAGGRRTGVLPDFFIGAHAVVAGLPLLTRDTQRYRTYFPHLTLIAPAAGNQ
jgi:predicted nucleic acid-binding protein